MQNVTISIMEVERSGSLYIKNRGTIRRIIINMIYLKVLNLSLYFIINAAKNKINNILDISEG